MPKLFEEHELECSAATLLEAWGASIEGGFSVRFNPRLRTRAGLARLHSRRIELNPRLLRREPEHARELLAHELAHLVVFQRHGRAAPEHGIEWAGLMRAAGFEPRRYHRFEVADVRVRRRRFYYLHLCTSCDAWWIARRMRRDRGCRSCGPGEIHVYRAVQSTAGLDTLRAIARGEA